jgi:hypothetical protein
VTESDRDHREEGGGWEDTSYSHLLEEKEGKRGEKREREGKRPETTGKISSSYLLPPTLQLNYLIPPSS